MCARRQITFETLEPRQLLSGSSFSVRQLASDAAALPQETAAAIVQSADLPDSAPAAAGTNLSARQFLNGSAQSASNRWDWLAQTSWYVPTENMLAYSMQPDLTNPQPIADQTIWYINSSTNGEITGQSVAKLSASPVPTQTPFTGIVTDSGQVRIEFQGNTVTTGIGQMRFVNGAWTVEMQMATGNSTLVSHWAYMVEGTASTTPPEPSATPPDGSLLSNEWRWLEGTRWALADTALFGTGAQAGVFQIDSFRNGYFWGSGTGTQPFNVFGSVTPEGNLLFLVSVNGATAIAQTGILQQTSSGGLMTLRSYEGTPAIGAAWTLPASGNPNIGPFMPSARTFLSSAASFDS